MEAGAVQRGGLPEHPPAGARPLTSSPAGEALRRELARKAVHVLSAAIPIGYAAGAPRPLVLWLLAALTAIALTVELARARSERVRSAFTRTVASLLREHEHDRWAGATWLLISFAAAVLVFPRDVAIAAMWAVAVGDAAAAIVGRSLGRHRLRGSAKTLEGSAAFLLAAWIGAAFVARLSPGAALVAAASAAIAEWPERPLDDNIRIVMGVGIGILLWRLLLS